MLIVYNVSMLTVLSILFILYKNISYLLKGDIT